MGPGGEYAYFGTMTDPGIIVKVPLAGLPFDFSLSNSGDITVVQGDSGSNAVTATLVSGSTQPVSLSGTGALPADATCSFNQRLQAATR